MQPLPGSLHVEAFKRHQEMSQLQYELKTSAFQLHLHLKILFLPMLFQPN